MAIAKHVHKLKKHKFKSGAVTYFCVLNCSYKVNPALALGKRMICWRCGQEFIMNEYSIRLVNPHCQDCHKSKSDDKYELSENMNDRVNNGTIPFSESSSLADRLSQEIKQHQKSAEEDI